MYIKDKEPKKKNHLQLSIIWIVNGYLNSAELLKPIWQQLNILALRLNIAFLLHLNLLVRFRCLIVFL
jgi:nitric oxide reductase large subunit